MLVECQQGVEKSSFDEKTNSVLIEDPVSHQQMAVEAGEITDNPQLHNGCDQYY